MNPQPIQWTTDDLAVMPDDWGWKRYEVIDGDLFSAVAPHIKHQQTASRIQFHLQRWSQEYPLGEVIQAPGLVLSPIDAVVPDLIWMSRDRLAQSLDEAGHLTVAPELVIEILSAGTDNEHRDRQAKRKLYSLYGVREYWIVSWRQQSLELYRRQDAQLQLTATLFIGDILTSPLLPDFALALADLFA